MAMQMRTWQLGCMVIGLLASATVGCGKDDDKPTRRATGGSAQGGNDETGGRDTTGGRNQAGDSNTGGVGNQGQAGDSNTGGDNVGGDEQTGGRTGGTGGRTGGTGGTGATGGTTGGEAGNVAETGGGGTGATGGSDTGGEAGNGTTGGTGGIVSTGEIDDVITSVCGWEFRCCDTGERAYRLAPFVDSADECVERFQYELHESNGTDNPHVSGSGAGLLGTLGYTVNLNRVTVNAAGVTDCVTAWEAAGCAVEAEPGWRCEGPGGADPCALSNLFEPALEVGDECTLALAEGGASNDIECPVGSTCLPAAHADNPADVPSCVSRGLLDDPCSQDDDCDHDFYCDSGNCAPKGAVGEACSFNEPGSPAPGDEDAQCQFGLTCHPVDFECVPYCTLGSTCATSGGDADLACPAGSSCAPIEVDELTEAFRVCTELGDTAAALCNSDADCEDDFYCDGENCQADKDETDPCTAQHECATGLHCDLALAEPVCTTNLAALDTCVEDYQCGTAAGCLNAGSDGVQCRSELIDLGDPCGEDVACDSGLCELATLTATETTCVEGEGLGDECDSQTADGDAQRCGPGLYCWGEATDPATGECIAKADPGMSCLDPADDPNAALCANGSTCEELWDGEGETCTDAPVVEAEGGTGLTCDGA